MNKELDLLVSVSSFAPQVTGTTILLDNMLSEFTGTLEVVSAWAIDSKMDESWKPVCKVNYIGSKNKFFNRLLRKYRFKLLSYYTASIKKKLKSLKPKAVLSVFPNDIFAVATYLACKKLDIPVLLHMHDLWEENMKGQALDFAKKWESVLIQNSEVVYCMTTTQQDHYRKKYGIETKLLPHTSSKDLLKKAENLVWDKDEKLVLYTGNVSDSMSLDAMQQFVKAVDLLPSDFKVVCLTEPNVEVLKKRSIYNEKIRYAWVSREEAQNLQNTASVLFMPLSHKNGSENEVRTVFTTKTLEYLVSGSPILTFAPSDSFHAIDSRKKNWSLVVDEDSPEALAKGIVKLATDVELAKELVRNSIIEAKNRNAEKYAKQLFNDIKSLN